VISIKIDNTFKSLEHSKRYYTHVEVESKEYNCINDLLSTHRESGKTLEVKHRQQKKIYNNLSFIGNTLNTQTRVTYKVYDYAVFYSILK